MIQCIILSITVISRRYLCVIVVVWNAFPHSCGLSSWGGWWSGWEEARQTKDTGSYIDLFYHWLSRTWQLIIVIRDINTYFNILSWTYWFNLTVWAHCSTISQYEGKYCIRLHLPSFILLTTYTKKCCSSKWNTARVRQVIRTGLVPTITWSRWVRMTKYVFESICCVCASLFQLLGRHIIHNRRSLYQSYPELLFYRYQAT